MFNNSVIDGLIEANKHYVENGKYCGDVSENARTLTANGQSPKAVIITCSDSRVIPEAVFGAGIGELFVIRVAGNVIDNTEIASVEYAVCHLGTKTVVVMGHTHCGAVGATLAGEHHGHVGHITRLIKEAVGEETDELSACKLNAKYGAERLKNALEGSGAEVFNAVYDIESGKVEFYK